ncbi:hypothetical protein EIL87_05830 [Saccharopolyspora rhizosphaerae]|uniref:MFS transporter n=1 Tax=Saccharopolyspora rhizosphaerae TaxID=2492662 RepID=A0A426JZV7_9PSEU|nr:hypothetical protein [Saccharopolyspora rhizosphaerae]RRO18636.1 hypothetical protein EIL87_05830 [Saccharopolyspora rhizosphaerae]
MRSRPVLLAAAGLHMVTETALAPFYPALFRTAFGVQDLAATGYFIAFTRIAAIIAVPLWGLATRRWRVEHLVLVGQSAAVVLTACLALAPSYAVFTGIGVALVAAKAVVLLAHPKTARTHPDGLLPGVRQYVAVLQTAVIAASAIGTWIVSSPDPRQALPLLAVVEAGLLVVCVIALRTPVAESAAPPPPPGVDVPRRALLPLAVLVLGFALAGAVVRPYFTEHVTAVGQSELVAALLFVAAHIAALAAVWRVRTASPGLVVPFVLAAAGLALQAAVTDPSLLALGRLVFGTGLGLGQVALDFRVLIAARGSGASYGMVAAAQHTGLLTAPLIAMSATAHDLAAPLVIGAGLFAVLAIITKPVLTTARPSRPRSTEVSVVPVRTP